jgi:hypothetical protein
MCCYHDAASGGFVLVSILPTRYLNNRSAQISQLPISPNCVLDAALVPEACLDRLVDLKGLINNSLRSPSALSEARFLHRSRPRGGRGSQANGMEEGLAWRCAGTVERSTPDHAARPEAGLCEEASY